MSNKILFIFEGEATEEKIVSSLQKFFVNESTTIKCVYGAEIYQIYKLVVTDNDLDTFNLIKERNLEKNAILADYNRDDFAEIYMFFDYDGHSTLADDNKLKQLLEFFNEETDKGKLYISYPMVESLKHISEYQTFRDLSIECKYNIKYKSIVAATAMKDLINFNNYLLETWKQLIDAHLKKMNFIVNNSYDFPDKLHTQQTIFLEQLNKYILPYSTVAILSAFPIFLHDYYGNEEIKKRLN